MLKDQDRIFTNLYGMHDRNLAGAKARGHWDGTAGIIEKGRDWIIQTMKDSAVCAAAAARASRPASNGPSCPRKATAARPIW